MNQPVQFLLTPPDRAEEAAAFGLPLAHMACHLHGDGRIAHTLPDTCPPAGLLLVGIETDPGERADPRRAVRALLELCTARRFRGVLLDPEVPPSPYLAQLVHLLEGELNRRQLSLSLPESWAGLSGRAELYLTSAISGGSLRRRLEEAATRYGVGRLTLCLRRSAEDFFLPAHGGTGQPLTRQGLELRLRQLSPTVFFSPDLCANYFTYMSRDTGAHFVLFDNLASLRKKRALAAELGIPRALLLYPELDDLLPALLA